MNDNQMDRRRFLSWAAKGSVAAVVVAAIGQLMRFLSFQPPNSTSTVVPVGPPDNFQINSLVYVVEARVYVGRDREGLYALDAVCPHLGCLVEIGEDNGFVCPCHDSRFDAGGQVLSGPATKSLRYLHLWFDQEQSQLFVDRAEPVEPATRLLV
jgi:cytochrome b6-f complex iron-sulfur subunit